MSTIAIALIVIAAATAAIVSERRRFDRIWNNGSCAGCGQQWDCIIGPGATTLRCPNCDRAEVFCCQASPY